MNPHRTILLLNTSNLDYNLAYPYAFVQVSEIADRFNIRTIRRDLFGIKKDQWEDYLQNLLTKTHIDMVLITLRNTDTWSSEEYQIRAENRNYHKRNYIGQDKHAQYYPIEATKSLIQKLRKITDAPVVIGGYAFSLMSEKLMNYIQPDYGVIGDPDAFFEHFEDILLKQNLNQVANVIFRINDTLQKGPLRFFPPASRKEYTDEIVADRNAFFSRYFSDQNVNKVFSIPLEVVRGCAMNCTYCSEPMIKGNKLRYRNLDVIEEEINFLGTHGLNRIMMVCSEINTEGNEFFLKLADRIIQINEKRSSYEKVHWYTFYLMNLSPDEMKHLRKAGFLGGASDIVSFDDNNLAAVKAPLKTKTVINHIIGVKKVIEEEFRQINEKYPSIEERIFRGTRYPNPLHPGNFMRNWNFFLGNLAATPETIRLTLKAVDDTGLIQHFDGCYVNRATRICDYIHPDKEVLESIWSITDKDSKVPYNELYPSFAYPPDLLRHFSNNEVMEAFFILIGDTYLSTKHLSKKEWNWFLGKNTDLKTFFKWWNAAVSSGLELNFLTTIPEVLEFLTFLHKNPTIENVNLLFNPTPDRRVLLNFAANIAIRYVLFSRKRDLIPVMKILGINPSLEGTLALSPYKFAVKLFKIFADKDEMLAALNASSFNNALSKFFIEYLIYLNDMPFRAEYRIFFE
ncbi:MAG: radical SAM protein [Candidatus Hodarchaeota archaeon]